MSSEKQEQFSYKRALERDIRKGLEEIRNLGSHKPLGYLPIDSLPHYFRSSVEDEIARAEKNGYDYMALGPDRCTIGSKGALFVFDRTSLQKLLDDHQDILDKFAWPDDVEQFIQRLAIEYAPKKTPLYDLIADAFGDKVNPERTDVEDEE